MTITMLKTPSRLRGLAEWTAGLDAAVLPADVNAFLAATALDWWGAAIAGTAHELHAPYVSAFASNGTSDTGCRVMGDARSWPLAEAAAANAAISHFWEFDDAHRAATMHPGITVYPVLFSIAQARPEIGLGRMRAAVIAGYEAGIKIGALLGKQHYAVCHSTATAGTFGAAATAAKLLGLNAEAILWAYGHAGTQAAGLWQILDDGAAAAKAFHAATAVRNGITAALLAQAGIPGATRILEGRRGMLAAWRLTPAWEADMTPPPGTAPLITDVTIKGWPVCGQMHSLLDATEALTRRANLAVETIARVEVEIPSAVLDIANVRAPRTAGEMAFSTSFCVAVLLSGGSLPFGGDRSALLNNPALQALAERIELVAEPAFDARFPKERPARIKIWTHSGMLFSEERSFRRGDPEQPWSWEALVERFRHIAALAGTSQDVQAAVIEWCAGFGRGDAAPEAASALFRAFPAPGTPA